MVSKKRVNISITPDTEERLKQYAYENHKNVPQAITDWIWSVKVSEENIRGQQSMEIIKPPEKKAARKEKSAPEQTEKPKRQSQGRKPKSRQRVKIESFSR